MQQGDLYLPSAGPAPVVCLLHGGFWRMPHGREQFDRVALDLCGRGHAVWNIGYRRLGHAGVGSDEIRTDVTLALAHVAVLAGRHSLDLERVAVVGHSAGGQLALACTSQRAGSGARAPAQPRLVASLAGLNDLDAAFASDAGKGAVRALLGGAPEEARERYDAASPIRLLPHGTRLALLHGTGDTVVSPSQSRDFAAAALRAGDDASIHEIPATGHMEFLDPASAAHRAVCAMLRDRLGGA